MMKCLFLVLFGFIALTYLQGTEARRFATCTCGGCRPSTFQCDYNTFGGCNCATCSCIRSAKPPTHTCCSTCKSGWGGKKHKCWTCPIGRGCNYGSCGCY